VDRSRAALKDQMLGRHLDLARPDDPALPPVTAPERSTGGCADDREAWPAPRRRRVDRASRPAGWNPYRRSDQAAWNPSRARHGIAEEPSSYSTIPTDCCWCRHERNRKPRGGRCSVRASTTRARRDTRKHRH
jgi:hypothetical protein